MNLKPAVYHRMAGAYRRNHLSGHRPQQPLPAVRVCLSIPAGVLNLINSWGNSNSFFFVFGGVFFFFFLFFFFF